MYKIYGDSLTEANWFRRLSPVLAEAPYMPIGARGKNPAEIERLIAYDRPDIILTKDGAPVLVVEKTREVPTGHNIGQRMARAVRAAEEGVPFVKLLPFDSRKHGKHTGICSLNVRLLDAFAQMTRIHNSPVIAVEWPSEASGELVHDGREDAQMRDLVDGFLKAGAKPTFSLFDAHRRANQDEYTSRVKVRAQYAAPPPSLVLTTTNTWLVNVDADSDTKAHLLRRAETLVYVIAMTPESSKRQDPYTGMQYVYDYQLARTGTRPSERTRNLVLNFPLLTSAQFYADNPFNQKTKSCNWYLAADAFSFADRVDLNPHIGCLPS